ncbi:MAG: hypothetical protein Q9221_000780 [Calogaya cf. arnoldii]
MRSFAPKSLAHIYVINLNLAASFSYYRQKCDAGGLYAGDDPRKDFRRFLNKAEKRKGLLPEWWTKEKRAACEAMGAGRSEQNWASLFSAVEKHDITEHYNDPTKPVMLRQLAEKVYGQSNQGGLAFGF